MNWKQKLSSRKFWASVGAAVTSVATSFGLSDSLTTQIVGIIGAVGSLVVYVISEAMVDAKREESK